MPIDLDGEFDSQAAPEPAPQAVEAAVTEAPDAVAEEAPTSEESFVPTWFNEIQEAMASPQLPTPQAPPMPMPPSGYPGNQPMQYQPPQQQQPARDPRYQDIDALFENPRNYVASILNQGMQQYQQSYGMQTQAEIARVMHANAQNAMYNAKQAIDRGYETVLNRDNSFRANPAVREIVEGTLKTLSLQAANAAYNGDFGRARQFENPRFYNALVSAAKSLAGVQGVNSEAAVPVGAVGERVSQKRDAGHSVALPADLEEVARTVNRPGFRENLEKEYAEAMRLGDITW